MGNEGTPERIVELAPVAARAGAPESAEAESDAPLLSDTDATSSGRLWSALDGELRHSPGDLVGATSLVAGTTVGAGILAIPTVTSASGYVPSAVVILGCWVYSCVTGLLVAEVNVRLMCELGRGGVSILSMSKQTLGRPGEAFTYVAYLFLHYALLVAYVARGGELIAQVAGWTGSDADGAGGGLGAGAGGLGFALLIGASVYFSSPRALDKINSVLVGGVVATFLVLVGTALSQTDPAGLLSPCDWQKAGATIPVITLAFVFHNVIPVVATSLEGDTTKIRTSILAGTGVPLAMFLLWNAAILGFRGGPEGAGTDPLDALIASEPFVGTLVQYFSILAIGTSFIGFVLGLVDFLSDGLRLPTNTKNPIPFALAIAPPTLFALSYPDVFVRALNSAGVFGVLTLFGVLPPAMAYQARQRGDLGPGGRLLPGGTAALVFIALPAALIVLSEVATIRPF